MFIDTSLRTPYNVLDISSKFIQSLEYAVIGIVALDAVPEEKKDIPLGGDDSPVPLIGLELVSNRPQRQTQHKVHKVGRNDPCPVAVARSIRNVAW